MSCGADSDGRAGGLAGPVDIEVLASSLPDKVSTGTGDMNVTVLPNYLRAVLDCATKRKAMRVNADLQRRKLEVMQGYISATARVSVEKIRGEREVELAKAGYDFDAQIRGIEAYRDAQLEAIAAKERVEMRAVDAQFSLQLAEVKERYATERRRADREWDAFDMLLDESRRRYRKATERARLKDKERQRLVRELEGACAYFMGRVKAGDPAAMGSYLALVNVRVNLLQGGGSFDGHLDSMIDGGMI